MQFLIVLVASLALAVADVGESGVFRFTSYNGPNSRRSTTPSRLQPRQAFQYPQQDFQQDLLQQVFPYPQSQPQPQPQPAYQEQAYQQLRIPQGVPVQQAYPVIRILKQIQEVDPVGNYRFSFQTENGIEVEEQAEVVRLGRDDQSIAKQGSYSYTGPDGRRYTVNWVADDDGFRATGDHLPTPPPIPEEIQRSLELNAQTDRDN